VAQYTLEEILTDLVQAAGSIDNVKAAIDKVAAIPSEQRKPSSYIACATEILAVLAPLADTIEAHVKS
jgi:hypothetical protein